MSCRLDVGDVHLRLEKLYADGIDRVLLSYVVRHSRDLEDVAAPGAEPFRAPSSLCLRKPSFLPEHRVYGAFSVAAAAVAPLGRSMGHQTEEMSTAGGALGRGDSRTQASPRPPTLEDRTLDRGHLPPLPA